MLSYCALHRFLQLNFLSIMYITGYDCQFLVFVEVDINVPHLMIGWML